MRAGLIVLIIASALSVVAGSAWAAAEEGQTIASAITFTPGDANMDGIVNYYDSSIIQAHYNQTGMTWAEGDFNGDGTVNGADFNALLSSLHASTVTFSGEGSVNSAAAVPEPSSFVLLGAGAVALLTCLWRRRRIV
jgi:hypothetical protein